MHLPERVKIGGFNFRVVEDDEPFRKSDGWGEIDFPNQRISISPKPVEEGKASTLIHEILHGILFATGKLVDEDLEEDMVYPLSRGLFAVLRENPQVVKYILEAK